MAPNGKALKSENQKETTALQLLERRHFIRHPMCFPLSYRILKSEQNNHKEESSRSLNVSVGGLLFSARHPVHQNSEIFLKIPFQDKTFNVKARVIRCEKDLETRLFNVGVRFFKVSDAFKAKLIEQLYLISEFRDLRCVQLGRDVSLEEASQEWIKRYSKQFKKLYW
ncbi:MAG: PilZ domain-containing protein [Candidatus Omnitrophica bacterium]|nr:PilZ domain-containing protein [Candidatus Omnitrophota bacterium]